MFLVFLGVLHVKNESEVPTWGWPLMVLMGLVFTGAGGVLVFGRTTLRFDISRGGLSASKSTCGTRGSAMEAAALAVPALQSREMRSSKSQLRAIRLGVLPELEESPVLGNGPVSFSFLFVEHCNA